MVDQPHRGFPWNSRTPQSIHIGNPEAVEAEVRHLNFDEKLLPPPGRLERKVQGEPLLGLGHLFKKGPECGRHRNRKRPVIPTLRRWKRHLGLGEMADLGFCTQAKLPVKVPVKIVAG